MKYSLANHLPIIALFALVAGCADQSVDVVDLNKVVEALVAVLDEGSVAKNAAPTEGGDAFVSATDGNAEVSSTAEIQAIEPEKQDPMKESDFLKKYAAKLNEVKVMASPVGVSMTAGGEIVGFRDPNQNLIQDVGESKEFTVTMDVSNNRLVASDNHNNYRPHGYGFSPSGMMMGYMLGSMMGRQNSYYSGAMSSAKPGFSNTPMSPANYHKAAVSSVRSSRISSGTSSAARARTGSKGFSFGK
ncbi:MAG TPA: hypothetical protein VM260_14295 [Pirellula sp.]|nr:hypothetical protein [Pirellula sp.]